MEDEETDQERMAMAGRGRDIIVIGTSAGGLEALGEVVGRLPPDCQASVFVVQHMTRENTGAALLHHLQNRTTWHCSLAEDHERFRPRRIYIARPDYHLLIKLHQMLVTKGALENRYRPAIDPLFRSAAVSHGPRVIGVVLSGMLDDGTVGLAAIGKCGGITVVQDPKDAAYPEMPESALNNVRVDHCVPLMAVAPLLARLSRERRGKRKAVPLDVRTEAVIAERVLSDVAQINGLGRQVPYNCPNCSGVLWEVHPSTGRYRCHTGHSFTASALLSGQSQKIEETLWTSLRMFEERKNLLNTMAQREVRPEAKRNFAKRAKDTEVHIDRIRAMLLAPRSAS
jgi:two-component system, chemotaxis family, protein-glutamate methylesterase/glutaminase